MKKPIVVLVLATLFASGGLRHVDADGIRYLGKLKFNEDHDGSAESVAFSPDGTVLSAGFNVVEGASPSRSRRSGAGGISKGQVVFRDVATKKMTARLELGGHVGFVSLSPNGKLLTAAHYDDVQQTQKVRIIEVATDRDRCHLSLKDDSRSPSSMTFSPDGKTLAIGTSGYPKGAELVLFDVAAGKEGVTLKCGDVSTSSLLYSADGKLLVSVSDVLVKVWDMTTETERNSFPAGRGQHAALSPDGSLIALSTTGSRKHAGEVALTLRDARTGKERLNFENGRSGTEIVFTPDGKKVIYGCGHGISIAYDVASGKAISITDGPTCLCLAMTKKGNMIATGNRSGTVWPWDISSLSGGGK